MANRAGVWYPGIVESGPVALAWSGGKDSLLALAELTAHGVDVAELLINVVDSTSHAVMHDVPAELLHEQAAALGLPCREIRLPEHASNTEYEAAVATAMRALRADGVTRVAFGDLHLTDVRAYREAQLGVLGIEALFPLWGRDTTHLMAQLLREGHRAVVVCVDTDQLDGAYCGRDVDDRFLTGLPAEVDPAGENGEYHTFVFASPLFARAVGIRRGEQTTKLGRFRYQDLRSAGQE